jgi:hypothetical protein
MNVVRSYHADGTRCADQSYCPQPQHTTIPPACGAVVGDAAPGSPWTCDLASGHPGFHVHAAAGERAASHG